MQHTNEATQEAITKAEQAGFVPARWQRSVDGSAITAWAKRVQEPGFAWRTGDHNTDAIIIGRTTTGAWAIHAGQHRILGGLLGGNPVPMAQMTVISTVDAGKEWEAGTSAVGGGFSVDDLMLALAL